ncbi:MAG: hypothetical protein IE878_03045, partial [Epsilonproteobacteria bacterium]|nr:hypothetical protein [Campylobacterota bacterium]
MILIGIKDVAVFISRTVIIFIELLLLLFAFVLFLFTDSSGLKIILDKVLTPYNITYDTMNGNITGIEIENLRYKKAKLADDIVLNVNPLTLMFQKITIQNIAIKGLEVNRILTMVEEISKNESKSSSKDDDTSSFDFAVEVKKLSLDVNPMTYDKMRLNKLFLEMENFNYHDVWYKDEPISFDSALLEVHSLSYLSLFSKKVEVGIKSLAMDKKDRLSIKDIYLNAPTNLTSLNINHANIKDNHFVVEKANFQKIDIKPLVKFINSIPKSNNKSKTKAMIESVLIKKTNANIIPTV